jgi:hypothetical protein
VRERGEGRNAKSADAEEQAGNANRSFPKGFGKNNPAQIAQETTGHSEKLATALWVKFA